MLPCYAGLGQCGHEICKHMLQSKLGAAGSVSGSDLDLSHVGHPAAQQPSSVPPNVRVCRENDLMYVR